MKPLYKVGDSVLIKSKYDHKLGAMNYRFGFTSEMKEQFGGTVCTILDMKEIGVEYVRRQVSDDGYLYHIKEDNRCWSWASSMFEPEF